MLRFGFFAGFRSFTGRERLRYTLAIHEGRSNEPGKPPNPHAHLIWSDRGHDGIERTASTWFKRYNGKAPERRDREWLAGGGEDVNGAELLGRLAQRAARHLIQAGVVRCRAPGSASGTSASGAFRGRRDLRPQNAIGTGAGLLPSTAAPTVLLSTSDI